MRDRFLDDVQALRQREQLEQEALALLHRRRPSDEEERTLQAVEAWEEARRREAARARAKAREQLRQLRAKEAEEALERRRKQEQLAVRTRQRKEVAAGRLIRMGYGFVLGVDGCRR